MCRTIKYLIIISFLALILWTFIIFIRFDVQEMKNSLERMYSTSILDINGNLMDVFLSDNEQWHIKIEDDIQNNLREAVLIYEDKNFYKHCGVDFFSIIRAIVKNFREKKEVELALLLCKL